MKITQEDVAKVEAAQPRKITPEMIAAATEQYEKDRAEREARRNNYKSSVTSATKALQVIPSEETATRFSKYVSEADEDYSFFKELDKATTRRIKTSKNMRIINNILAYIGKDHYDGQNAVLGGNEAEIVARGSHEHRVTVSYASEYDEFEIYYGDQKMHFHALSNDYIAGVLTQLINVILINSSTNTIAYENGEESALRSITNAVVNLFDDLDMDCTRAGVLRCLDDHRLTDLNDNTYIHVPHDYLPLGVLDELDEEVFSGNTFPEEDDIDAQEEEFKRRYRSRETEIMESDKDFTGFDDRESLFDNVWDIHSDKLLESNDYIDWSCVKASTSLEDPLPYCADDFSVPISILARTLSDTLMYELEPYEKDINVNYGDYITAAALYILIVGDSKLENGCYTPVFRATLSYEQFRKHLGDKIIALFGKYNMNDPWKVAERQDLYDIILKSIDKAMWSAELENRDL